MAVLPFPNSAKRHIRDFRRGDKAAFGRLFVLIEPKFRRQLRRYQAILPSHADDLAQTAFVGLLKGIYAVDLSYPNSEQYVLWFSRSYISKSCRSITRLHGCQDELEEEFPLEDLGLRSPEDTYLQDEAESRLYLLVDQLDEPYRTICALRFLPDAPWSVRAISRHLGLERKRTKALLDEGQRQLRELEEATNERKIAF